jgi:hypothetical protein
MVDFINIDTGDGDMRPVWARRIYGCGYGNLPPAADDKKRITADVVAC